MFNNSGGQQVALVGQTACKIIATTTHVSAQAQAGGANTYGSERQRQSQGRGARTPSLCNRPLPHHWRRLSDFTRYFLLFVAYGSTWQKHDSLACHYLPTYHHILSQHLHWNTKQSQNKMHFQVRLRLRKPPPLRFVRQTTRHSRNSTWQSDIGGTWEGREGGFQAGPQCDQYFSNNRRSMQFFCHII